MASILTPRPDDRPPQREEWGVGATLSAVVHLGLIGALAWSVHWHSSSEPEGSTAELWAAVPTAAAPPPTTQPEEIVPPPPPPAPTPPAPEPAPPPPPPTVVQPTAPEIVTEQLEKKLREKEREREAQDKLDKAKLDAQQKADQQKADADKQKAVAQQKLDAQKLAKLHDENVRRMMGQMDAPPTSTGTAARSSGPSASYAGRIAALVRGNLTWVNSYDGIKSPEVNIRVGVDGTILSEQITRTSGNPAFDAALLQAIQKTRTLPRDTDGKIPPEMILSYRPQD